MPDLVSYLLIFTAVGVGFILVNLMLGKLLRPAKMDAEKGTIYECGEPPVGSAWVQFDLRFYVVALLFVIFDVEMAFFFPWAVVFGKANQLADVNLPVEERIAQTRAMTAFHETPEQVARMEQGIRAAMSSEGRSEAQASFERVRKYYEGRIAEATSQEEKDRLAAELAKQAERGVWVASIDGNATAARDLAWVAFFDILFFFGVLLVGFAYLWNRGDLNWVRSLAAQEEG